MLLKKRTLPQTIKFSARENALSLLKIWEQLNIIDAMENFHAAREKKVEKKKYVYNLELLPQRVKNFVETPTLTPI